MLNAAGAFPVHRERADVEAVQTAVRLAQEGNVVVMFPEGTRRKKGLVKKHQAAGTVRRGADRAGRRSAARPRGHRRHRPAAHAGAAEVAYGAPIEMDDLLASGDMRRASQEATERLMARIAELEASL